MMNRKKQSKGFSLVELMIGLALGSLVTVGVIQLFVANQESYNLLQGQSRMQESARFAFDFIGRSVRKAGYRGCFSNVAGLLNVPETVPYSYNIQFGVEGYNDVATSITTLPKSISGTDANLYVITAGTKEAGNGINTDDLIPGTDILTLRNMSETDYRLTAQMANAELDPVVYAPDGFPFTVDDMVMIHDCEKATVFRITGLSVSGDEVTIEHSDGDVDIYRNSDEALALQNTFDDDAAVSGIESNIFYLAYGEGLNNYGNRPLSLWRKQGLNAPVELVEGVEDMQILYGEDSDEDGVPNQYKPANFVTDWSAVETIRVTLVVNSVDDVGSTSLPSRGCAIQGCITGEVYDGLIRRPFTQTFHLRN